MTDTPMPPHQHTTGADPHTAIVSLTDFAPHAPAALPADIWDFLDGGSGTETTLTANRTAWDAVSLLPRVLRGIEQPTLHTTLAGQPAAMPVAVAPMAYQRLLHPDGELALAAAAHHAGVPYTASTLSSYPIERITATGATVWFQLYWLRDRALVLDLVARAEQAGCTALMVTVDVPILGRRLRDLRHGFTLPADVTAANLPRGRQDLAHHATPGVSAVAAHTHEVFAPALTWPDLEWLRGHTRLPLLVKGILDPRDATLAAAAGADAVIVSNHGGRQFDGAPATITILPEVIEAVENRCPVLIDSGVRSGLDVLRALALGAAGTLLGRPLLWALALQGRPGAERALRILADQLRHAFILAGCADPSQARDLRTLTESRP